MAVLISLFIYRCSSGVGIIHISERALVEQNSIHDLSGRAQHNPSRIHHSEHSGPCQHAAVCWYWWSNQIHPGPTDCDELHCSNLSVHLSCQLHPLCVWPWFWNIAHRYVFPSSTLNPFQFIIFFFFFFLVFFQFLLYFVVAPNGGGGDGGSGTDNSLIIGLTVGLVFFAGLIVLVATVLGMMGLYIVAKRKYNNLSSVAFSGDEKL